MKKQLKRTDSFSIGFMVLLILSFAVQLTGQITIDKSDMPSAGDTIRISTALNASQYDFAETGTGSTWDFSGLAPITQTVDTFIQVLETPVLYWPFFALSANLASPMPDSPLEQLPLTDIYNYYNNSTERFIIETMRITG